MSPPAQAAAVFALYLLAGGLAFWLTGRRPLPARSR